MKILKLFAVFIFLLIVSCEKSQDCPREFVVYGEVLPYAETYKVGDTITLQTIYSPMIYDKNTKQYYDLKGLDIEAILYIFKIDTLFNNKYKPGVLDYVDVINNNKYSYYIENFSSGDSELFSNILFDANYFYHELKIVLKKKGVYMLTYGPSTLENNFNFEGACDHVNFDLYTRLNNGLDNNINLLKDSPDEHFNTWILQKPEERFYQARFAYRVIE